MRHQHRLRLARKDELQEGLPPEGRKLFALIERLFGDGAKSGGGGATTSTRFLDTGWSKPSRHACRSGLATERGAFAARSLADTSPYTISPRTGAPT